MRKELQEVIEAYNKSIAYYDEQFVKTGDPAWLVQMEKAIAGLKELKEEILASERTIH